jgi:hypothetical protein
MSKISKFDKKKYSCKYCGLEFYSKEECVFHQDNECDFNPNLLKDKSVLNFIRFLIASSLHVAGLAFLVITPALLYLCLLIYLSPQHGYVAMAIFWIVLFGVTTILASIVDYLRKSKSRN